MVQDCSEVVTSSPVDSNSSSSEDLQYGPGIVNKLKNKYLNLTLRETNRASRILRKANSLENLLDSGHCRHYNYNNNSSNCKSANDNCNNLPANGSYLCSVSNDQKKRAQSMEALDFDTLADELDNVQIQQNQRNIDSIITNLKRNLNESCAPSSHRRFYRRHHIFLNDTERPPQDVVKKAMRIFENAVNRKPRDQVGAEVALKVANFKSIIDHERPVLRKFQSKKPPSCLNDSIPIKLSIVFQSEAENYEKFEEVNGLFEQMEKLETSIFMKYEMKVAEVTDCNVQSCSVVNKVLPFLKDCERNSPNELNEELPPTSIQMKQISEEQLTLLKKCGTSVPIVINNSNSKTHLPSNAFYQYRSKEITNFNSSSATFINSKQVGIIKPLVTNKQSVLQKESGNEIGEQEVKKVTGDITNDYNLKKTEINFSPPVTKVVTSSNSESTSMVFNFSNRKHVPDYIQIDGRCGIFKGEEPRLNSKPAYDDVDAEVIVNCDLFDYLHRPPSPCNVSFTNDNVVIDGKSSISSKSVKREKMRIKFDDSATMLFEYPSEISELNEDNNSASKNSKFTNYVPAMLSFSDTKFQLGITKRRLSPAIAPTTMDTEDNCGTEEKMPWNSVTATDLLF